jgi:hypothetical protein
MMLSITPNIRRSSVFKYGFLEEEFPYFMALKNKYEDVLNYNGIRENIWNYI